MSDNIQVLPSLQRVVPNFKLTKVTANLSKDDYAEMVLDGGRRAVVEKKKHKKHGEVLTIYTIANANGYDNTDPLTVFDYAVLSVCISEWLAGNRYTTPAIILRGLTGKVGKSDAEPSRDQRAAILNSVQKLMSTIIKIDQTETNQALNYEGNTKITSTLLPAYFITNKLNGQIIDDIIFFDREPPFIEIAKARKQFITYDSKLLDVPNQNNTPLVITIKNETLRRIQEIKLHKLQSVISIDSLFSSIRIADKSKKTKQDARITLDKFLNHLQNIGEIQSFQWNKRGNHFLSVKFYY